MSDHETHATHIDRRELLLAGGAGLLAATLGVRALTDDDEALAADAASVATACILTPEATEGPFYVDLERIRNDIKEAKAGLRLRLRVAVLDVRTCKPLPNSAVDIWHCDALGNYSGVNGASTTFLRGIQIANSAGIATFETIYPGWYPGRATHIHLKVHVGGTRSGSVYSGGQVSHTGQLFFPDRTTDALMRRAPYNRHAGRRTRNAEDGIFAGAGGSKAIVKLTQIRKGVVARGYTGSIVLGVDPTATP